MQQPGGEDAEGLYREDPARLREEADYHLPFAIERLRGIARRKAALAAEELSAVREVTSLLAQSAAAELACGPRVPGQPDADMVTETAVVSGVAVALGISEWQAGRLTFAAQRLARALPQTCAALAAGRLDLERARAVVEATADCALDEARDVDLVLLGSVRDGPWEGLSPRQWRDRIWRMVANAAPDLARGRRERAVGDRAVRSWAGPDGDGVLRLTAPVKQAAVAETVVAALADRRPAVDEHGRTLTVDQRRADAMLDLFRQVRDGEVLPLPGAGHDDEPGIEASGGDRARRRSDVDRVTLVLHADTFLGEGLARWAPGQVRGLGTPAHLDNRTTRRLADGAVAAGAAMQVLLTDRAGQLQQVVNMRRRPAAGWTRERLTAEVREALRAEPPALETDAYRPTAAIARHVQTRNPHCTSYDCPRTETRCDLDHDQPWPRGPTTVSNLQPRCPRHHEHKTRRLVHTSLHPDGSVAHRILRGLAVTTAPEPLPGHGPYEGHDLVGFSDD